MFAPQNDCIIMLLLLLLLLHVNYCDTEHALPMNTMDATEKSSQIQFKYEGNFTFKMPTWPVLVTTSNKQRQAIQLPCVVRFVFFSFDVNVHV